MEAVRERTLEVLDEVDLDDPADPLLRDGFVYEMLLAHEHQHNETMLQLLQMVDLLRAARGRSRSGRRAGRRPAPRWSRWRRGASRSAPEPDFSYDNERPRHAVELRPFLIDRAPVSNGRYADFVADTGAEPPMYWERDGEGGWVRTAMGRTEPLDPDHPVVHVSYEDATAFARWEGKRLPSEHEWEAACAGADRERANLDQLAFGTAPAGAYADGASDCGAVQMLGDVWEWTELGLHRLPGVRGLPLSRVLRGLLRRRPTRCCGAAPGRPAAT